MKDKALQQSIEAMLFSSPHVVSIQQLQEILDGEPAQRIRDQVQKLNQAYEKTGRVFRIEEIAKGFQMRTLSEYRPWIQKLEPVKPIKLSLPTIETLAIVAYKQPITRAGVEIIRGVDSSYTLRTLMQKKLLRIVGKEEIPGRPILYGTSKLFLEVFGLREIKNLPALSELDLDKDTLNIEQTELFD